MNIDSGQAVSSAQSSLRGKKRGKWLILTALIAMSATYIWADARLLARWIPIELFRDVPEVTQLHPVVKLNKDKLIEESKKIGIPIRITSDFRSSYEQDALYRQGREEEGAIVTHSKGGESYHNYGLAIDFVLQLQKGQVSWDIEYDGNGNGKSDWMEVVAIAKNLGFSWGGDWESFPDYPHLQMDFGYSIRDLQWGWRPPENDTQNTPITGRS
ncbi:M15 family metallopeptidase [Cohnella sp.]|uniref:M15 family metallopeptidase n=1 Tax=Cohnella sp. TaxID=1883426 RepID=UPI00356522B5